MRLKTRSVITLLLIKASRLTACVILTLSLAGVSREVAAANEGKLGFVVESWYTAIYDTEYMEECPEGIVIGNDEVWFNALSPEEKEIETGGGTLQVLDLPRRPNQYLRGPNDEDVCWHPEFSYRSTDANRNRQIFVRPEFGWKY
ncbi:MAG: hypothetical protein ACJZ9F_02740 [Rhodospirillaceae bacterium]